jgi:hypothetical protein
MIGIDWKSYLLILVWQQKSEKVSNDTKTRDLLQFQFRRIFSIVPVWPDEKIVEVSLLLTWLKWFFFWK